MTGMCAPPITRGLAAILEHFRILISPDFVGCVPALSLAFWILASLRMLATRINIKQTTTTKTSSSSWHEISFSISCSATYPFLVLAAIGAE
jgi:hypothetical protein